MVGHARGCGRGNQLPKKPREVIEEVLNIKEAPSQWGNAYCQFLVKWLGKAPTESTLRCEEELQKIDPSMYDLYIQVFSLEPSFFSTQVDS